MTLHQTSTTIWRSTMATWQFYTTFTVWQTFLYNHLKLYRVYATLHLSGIFLLQPKSAYTTFAIWLTFLYNHLTRPISTRQPPWAICHHLTPCIFTIPSRTPIYGSILFVYHLIFSIRPLYSRKETTWWHSTRRLSFSQETIGQWEMYFNEDSRAKISQGTTQ